MNKTDEEDFQIRFRELGFSVGELPTGSLNAITDVTGVKVGHQTNFRDYPTSCARTGVTVILPHSFNLFEQKVRAACFVMNGFGKTIGLSQIHELGTIESPIAITNTFNVPRCAEALIEYKIARNPSIGAEKGSVNVIVGECNDGWLNDLRGLYVTKKDTQIAINNSRTDLPAEGCVGAGTGMIAFGYKSGIGTSSRLIQSDKRSYTVGVLCVPNFGRRRDLNILGIPIGKLLSSSSPADLMDGSIMTIIATDAYLTSRQLKRLTKRAVIGFGRVGSIIGAKSGDFIIAFSTTSQVSSNGENIPIDRPLIAESSKVMNLLFRAVIEATEESILNALFMATSMTGFQGHFVEKIPVNEIQGYLQKVQSLGLLSPL
ncbi:MAG: P1 family peptidase [Promethearchaeota archaeon]